MLQDWDIIEPADDGYRFRIELLRRWIAEYKPLNQVQEELDRIEPVANNLYHAAFGLYRNGQLETVFSLLRQAIKPADDGHRFRVEFRDVHIEQLEQLEQLPVGNDVNFTDWLNLLSVAAQSIKDHNGDPRHFFLDLHLVYLRKIIHPDMNVQEM